jgi:hypothetical protein
MTARNAPRALGTTLSGDSLPVIVCAAFVGLLGLLVSRMIAADGWLALVSGRLIAHDGLPRHDTLAALTSGREWIDQQWLGQLAVYGVETIGGLRLLLALNVVFVAGAYIAAAVYARRRGAAPTTLAIVLLAVLLPFLITAMNVRTQSFAYLPFVAIVAALSQERPLSRWTTVAVLAALVLWANVHGSSLLAAGLIALRGAVDLASRPAHRRTAWVLLVAPWACLLVSPYHVHLVSYYGRTAFNPSFSTYLGQWAPTTFSPVSASLLALAFATVWMLGRSTAAYTRYQQCLLLVAVLLALLAVRNWAFASLLLVMLAPQGFDRALRKRAVQPAPAVGGVIAGLAALGAIVGVVAALSSSRANLTHNYPAGAGSAVAAAVASHPTAQVYAGIPFADWLLWTQPKLAGKVVFDVRYELLHPSEVRRLALFDAGSELRNPLGHPVAYLLDPTVEKDPLNGLRPDVRTVYKTDHAVVVVERNGR